MIPFLASTSLDDLKTYCKEHGFPAFRASQIDSWLHTHCIVEPEMMKNLPNDLLEAADIDGCGEIRKFTTIVLPKKTSYKLIIHLGADRF